MRGFPLNAAQADGHNHGCKEIQKLGCHIPGCDLIPLFKTLTVTEHYGRKVQPKASTSKRTPCIEKITRTRPEDQN